MKQILCLVLLIIIVTSCEKEEKKEDSTAPPTGGPSFSCDTASLGDTAVMHGVFIVNEGAFGSANGDISYYSSDGTFSSLKLFNDVNGIPLGDVVQSMYIYSKKAYLVVNNSQKVEVVNMDDFTSAGTIAGFNGPRYFVAANNSTGYVSDWFSNSVKIIDLNSNTVTGSIPVGNGPEQMIISNNKLFVTNVGKWNGATSEWENDSTVSVIDLATNTVTSTFTVGINPNSIAKDAYGKLWVLSGGTTGPDFIGGTADDIAGSLYQVDPATNGLLRTILFSQSEHPFKITANCSKTSLFFLNGNDGYNGAVYKMNATDSVLPASPVVNRSFYGLGIQPSNGNIYGGIGSFTTNSWALRYSESGVLIDSMETGIGPNGFVFN